MKMIGNDLNCTKLDDSQYLQMMENYQTYTSWNCVQYIYYVNNSQELILVFCGCRSFARNISHHRIKCTRARWLHTKYSNEELRKKLTYTYRSILPTGFELKYSSSLCVRAHHRLWHIFTVLMSKNLANTLSIGWAMANLPQSFSLFALRSHPGTHFAVLTLKIGYWLLFFVEIGFGVGFMHSPPYNWTILTCFVVPYTSTTACNAPSLYGMSLVQGPWSSPLMMKCISALFESNGFSTYMIPIRDPVSVGNISEPSGETAFSDVRGIIPLDVLMKSFSSPNILPGIRCKTN